MQFRHVEASQIIRRVDFEQFYERRFSRFCVAEANMSVNKETEQVPVGGLLSDQAFQMVDQLRISAQSEAGVDEPAHRNWMIRIDRERLRKSLHRLVVERKMRAALARVRKCFGRFIQ